MPGRKKRSGGGSRKCQDKKSRHNNSINKRHIVMQPTTALDSDNSDYEGCVNDKASGSENVCVHALPEPPYTPVVINEVPESCQEFTHNQQRQNRKLKHRQTVANAESRAQAIASRTNLAERTVPDNAAAATPLDNNPTGFATAEPTTPSPSLNVFQRLSNWRWLNREVMDEATLPGGCWDRTIDNVNVYSKG